jgi:simple sugar transport system ATP-binding protein
MLKIENLYVNDISRKGISKLEDFNLEIRSGEIVAIAGIEGNGQSELINVISGLQKAKKGKITLYNHITQLEIKSSNGAIKYKRIIFTKKNVDKYKKKFGKDFKTISQRQETNLSNINIKHKYRSGIAHIPEDRHKYGLVLDMSL